ncbi:hypothetical protein [Acidithiobacillus concretivorus]|uniref:Uncharacterized protein n=1 Tax=Acidithiobacillus concretivorus TaxID=3063952 RepID=A0ABS5ZT80_9PROT|nr:hypothetical protein [Acidithiobacillus concretivorus]MBU2739883.1 hypothetical protein [Acidithiobacillus concretivorus]
MDGENEKDGAQSSILEIGLVMEDAEGQQIPAIQMRLYPMVQQALLEAVDQLRHDPEQEYIRVTLYGTAERGVQMDFSREALLNLVSTIQENRLKHIKIQ